MYDHCTNIKAWSNRGLSVACITSETSKKTKDDVISGVYQLLFFTPELPIAKQKWRELLRSEIYTSRIQAFIVDEAHCIKKWYDKFSSYIIDTFFKSSVSYVIGYSYYVGNIP